MKSSQTNIKYLLRTYQTNSKTKFLVQILNARSKCPHHFFQTKTIAKAAILVFVKVAILTGTKDLPVMTTLEVSTEIGSFRQTQINVQAAKQMLKRQVDAAQ